MKQIDGITYKQTHSGQKRAYGDSFYEYDVTSDLPASDVECICAEHLCKAIPMAQWRNEMKAGAEAYFRNHYTFTAVGGGKFRYSVCFPYAD